MRLINLTPHTITLVGTGGATETIQPSGPPARVTLASDIPDGVVEVGSMDVPLVRTARTSEVTGLPEPQDGVLYVVSRQVVEAMPERKDLVFTHLAVRGAGNQIIGCRALARPA